MKNPFTTIKIKPFTLAVVLGVLLLFGNSLKPTEAQLAGNNTIPYPFSSPATDATTNLCQPGMKDFASKELQNFNQFLDTNFQNKSSTISLLNVAMGKYRNLRTELYTAFGQYSPNVGSAITVSDSELSKCQDIINQTLSDAKNLLKIHAVRTSGVKKSTALLEKYKQINAQLADLFQQFVYMRSYLDTFAGKMPCYPKSGCVKG